MVSRIQQKGNQHPIFGAAFGFTLSVSLIALDMQ